MKQCTCNAIGCRAAILDAEIFCRRHLSMVESDTRRVLAKHFRLNRRQSAIFDDALRRAQSEILYFQTNGHPVPKDRPFMWDDDDAAGARGDIG